MKKVLFIFTLSFLIVFSLFSLTCINHSDSVNSQSNNSESVQWIFVNVKGRLYKRPWNNVEGKCEYSKVAEPSNPTK